MGRAGESGGAEAMSEPTAATMRAARACFDAAGTQYSEEIFAAIINRETGLPELLAAAKGVITCEESLGHPYHYPDLRAAIARAEKGEA